MLPVGKVLKQLQGDGRTLNRQSLIKNNKSHAIRSFYKGKLLNNVPSTCSLLTLVNTMDCMRP